MVRRNETCGLYWLVDRCRVGVECGLIWLVLDMLYVCGCSSVVSRVIEKSVGVREVAFQSSGRVGSCLLLYWSEILIVYSYGRPRST
jgi:hypothetical protein